MKLKSHFQTNDNIVNDLILESLSTLNISIRKLVLNNDNVYNKDENLLDDRIFKNIKVLKIQLT